MLPIRYLSLKSIFSCREALYYGGPRQRVEQQIESLGQQNVGFGDKTFVAADGTQFSVVGARPFSDVSRLSAMKLYVFFENDHLLVY